MKRKQKNPIDTIKLVLVMTLHFSVLNMLARLTRRKLLILPRNGAGLGNRLKFMASYHVYHGLENAVVIWPAKGWVSAPFNSLFDLNTIPRLKVHALRLDRFAGFTFPSLGQEDFWRLKIESDEVGEDFFIQRHGRRFKSIDFRYADIPLHVRTKYLKFFSVLEPSLAVKRRMMSVPIDSAIVCVHVRNPVSGADAKGGCTSITWFLEHMHNNYPTNTRFFISTMGLQYSKIFHEEFGDRIIELPFKNYSSMVDAVADLFLLSRGSILVASSGSTFPEVAWWIGNCKQTVVCAPPEF